MRRLFLVAAALSCAACGESAPPEPTTDEGKLRARLGIPADAGRVVVFGQAAHLDVDWQRTFPDYYSAFVEKIFTEARQVLDTQPRAHYSVAEMAFLEHHVEAHPEELAALKAHAARGALHIVGGGVTSPDTLLPETELLMRDFLHGARFSEDVLGARAHAAWLPDSFGHAATTPDLLAAAGLDSAAFSRIDGAPTFFWAAIKHETDFTSGSTAAMLRSLGSADFVWRGPGGGKVLAHFMPTPGLYCQGDNLDYQEDLQLPGGHLGVFMGDDPVYTDGKIDGYIAELEPFAKTDYVFVPVGCDFQHPKDRLIEYLDGYNQRRYPSTGVWAAAASFEDYAALVRFHVADLPEIAADLAPYFMGFYGSRADVKQRTRDAARPLLSAEPFAALLAGDDRAAAVATMAKTMTLLARTDHHDFITGTAADPVMTGEQIPLLTSLAAESGVELSSVTKLVAARIKGAGGALRLVVWNPAPVARTEVIESAEVLAGLSSPSVRYAAKIGDAAIPVDIVTPLAGDPGSPALRASVLLDLPPLGWRAVDLTRIADDAPLPPSRVTVQLVDDGGQPASGSFVTRVVLHGDRAHAEFLRRAGGFALTTVRLDGIDVLAGDSFLLRDYDDQGGLWRMGHEMKGCSLSAIAPAGDGAAESVEIVERTAYRVRVRFHAAGATREATLDAGSAALALHLATGATPGTTRTALFTLAADDKAPRRTSMAGGFAERARERLFAPTYWPAVEWLSAGDVAILLRQSTGVRFGDGGSVEVMAARDARLEACENLGGMGSDTAVHEIDWRMERAPTALDAARAAGRWNRPPIAAMPSAAVAPAEDLPVEQSLASIDGDGLLSALKPADRGEGVIVRVLLLPGPVTIHLGAPLANRTATLVDAAERDLAPMGHVDDTLVIDGAKLPANLGSIVSVRLR